MPRWEYDYSETIPRGFASWTSFLAHIKRVQPSTWLDQNQDIVLGPEYQEPRNRADAFKPRRYKLEFVKARAAEELVEAAIRTDDFYEFLNIYSHYQTYSPRAQGNSQSNERPEPNVVSVVKLLFKLFRG